MQRIQQSIQRHEGLGKTRTTKGGSVLTLEGVALLMS